MPPILPAARKGHRHHPARERFRLNRLETLEQFNGLAGIAALKVRDEFPIARYRPFVPRPSINERLRLSLITLAHVVVNLEVVTLGIEGWINVAEVNGFILDLATQDVQVVTVVKGVGHEAILIGG